MGGRVDYTGWTGRSAGARAKAFDRREPLRNAAEDAEKGLAACEAGYGAIGLVIDIVCKSVAEERI
jgi:hypothetical protein